ncbi:MAG TPA: long-chain-acyl-CoA synthetase [Methylomirabilota bacterium]|nr:long-chain-acyl-CoA synthetase [Methylomirabilota bacterium]
MNSFSANKSWVRALELTAPIINNPHRILPIVIEELAEKLGEAPALLSDRECLTYRGLAERSNRYSRWALDQGLAKGDTVCLLMPNRPEYMAIWLGITRMGGVVALLNTNLTGPSLAHSIRIVEPKYLIVSSELMDRLPNPESSVKIWGHGVGDDKFPRIDLEIEQQGSEKLGVAEVRPTIQDPALYIYTSGTTGLPKAARVNHYRLMQWSHWFAGMIGTRPEDRMYNCLPMYHGVGGVVATGAALVGGGSVVVREKFSAREFWNDISRWDCTLFQYIGELCRYLLNTEANPRETGHRIRMACGNGLRADIWDAFKSRFRIPRILEFYAAAEGTVSLTNADEKPGSIGRVPPYLAHRFPVTLVQFDIEKEFPVRNDRGFCIPCGTNEIGEAIGKVFADPANLNSRFDGYTSREASDKKILRNVFEPGDAWFRSGDLMRKDEKGYFYFVDRIGDTFRWKGENVSTYEVSEAICAFPGIREAAVYGVTVPGTEGRAGMAALVAEKDLDLGAFRSHLIERLPAYARPLFLRIRKEIETTTTFKHAKSALMRESYEPVNGEVIYFNDPKRNALVRLDRELYDRIQTGQVHL